MECMFECTQEATYAMVTVNDSQKLITIQCCINHIDEAARL